MSLLNKIESNTFFIKKLCTETSKKFLKAQAKIIQNKWAKKKKK